MNTPRSIRGRSLRSILLLGLIAVLLGLLAPPLAALAHPLDVCLQATYITVAPTQIVVELDLSPGVLVAPQVLPQLDTDGDQQISDAEGQAYVDAMLRHVVLQVDGKPLAPAVTKIDMPAYLTIQAGYGTIRIFTIATPAAGMAGTHQLSYTNSYAPTGSAYQVNAFVDKGVAIRLGKQNRDSIQQSMTMEYTIGSAAPAATTSTTAATTGASSLDTSIGAAAGASGQARQLLAYLYAPALSPWVLLLALALAGALGGLHALTPGHGKTLVAAYLVGNRGTVRHAVALGAIMTFTHTASVIVIGLLALFASQFIVPDVLVPILEILSGLLVVFMGARLAWQRWIAFHSRRSPDHDHAHNHGHSHDHGHDHGDGHTHAHLPPAEGIKLGSLLAMGVSGGLVPCPEALGIMVIAIGLNRILLGLGLIVSFSFGLAAVLIVLGILLVRSRSLVERFGGIGDRWRSALPLCSAVIVTVLGIGMTLNGLVSYLG
jgi:ABC-type nickel/cobalt efflux system permease component RcnA